MLPPIEWNFSLKAVAMYVLCMCQHITGSCAYFRGVLLMVPCCQSDRKQRLSTTTVDALGSWVAGAVMPNIIPFDVIF